MIVIVIPVETEQPVLMVLMIIRVHACLASLDPIVKLVRHDYYISRLIETLIFFDCWGVGGGCFLKYDKFSLSYISISGTQYQ